MHACTVHKYFGGARAPQCTLLCRPDQRERLGFTVVCPARHSPNYPAAAHAVLTKHTLANQSLRGAICRVLAADNSPGIACCCWPLKDGTGGWRALDCCCCSIICCCSCFPATHQSGRASRRLCQPALKCGHKPQLQSIVTDMHTMMCKS